MTTTTHQEAGLQIAAVLVAAGVVTQEQVDYAARIQTKLGGARPLTDVLQELDIVTAAAVRDALRRQPPDIAIETLLLELGEISEAEMKAANALCQESGKSFGEVLIENHFLSEDDFLQVLSVQSGLPYLAGDLLQADKRLLARFKPAWLQKRRCFPVAGDDGAPLLVVSDLPADALKTEAARVLGQEPAYRLARRGVVERAIAAVNQTTVRGDLASESEIVRTVNEILAAAAGQEASDIHIEPMKTRVRVRFREDGVLVMNRELPLEAARALASRIKIMAGADIAERRRHQDGRLLYEYEGAKIDMRVSFYSTIHGEKIVMRLLNNRSTLLDVQELGMSPRMATRFQQDVLDVPSGVVLVTGPTGSGKTTTLYGAINYLNNINTSILTAEDPVEYVIDGIGQCSINAKIGTTYEETLRHIVRQDPDVIVIGEIRDRFSADTAIQAALTGHKVLTTFHTEDSIGGLLRLLHMDIEAFLISSTVVSVIAQRLVRRVCPRCAEEHRLTPDEIRRLGYNPKEVEKLVFARGKGCEHCRFQGYKGRLAVFELLILNEAVKDALISRATSYEIRRTSLETTGMVSLLEDGIAKAAAGQTSFEEIIRTLPRLSPPRPLNELHRLQGVRR
jgi:type IV pilus assembly protein PilB